MEDVVSAMLSFMSSVHGYLQNIFLHFIFFCYDYIVVALFYTVCTNISHDIRMNKALFEFEFEFEFTVSSFNLATFKVCEFEVKMNWCPFNLVNLSH